MASQSHIGHATSLWHPANAKYIFGVRGHHDPIHIISLDVIAAHLRRACKIVHGVTERGGLVLFVGSREGQARCVVNAASMSKGCHLFTKWIPGTITNGQQILGKCKKKVINEHDEEVEGFEDQLVQKAAVKPDLVVCLNPLENYILLHECALNNIPTIGIVDTDVNSTWVTYPIPANDDSLRCVQLIAGILGRAGEEGQLSRRENRLLPARQDHGLEPPTIKEQDDDDRDVRDRKAREKKLLEGPGSYAEEEEAAVFGARMEEDDERAVQGVDGSLLADQMPPESQAAPQQAPAERVQAPTFTTNEK
jgi:small subunit ribosomal protein S2